MPPSAPSKKVAGPASAAAKRKEAPSSNDASKKGSPAPGAARWPVKRLKMSEDRKIVTQEPGYALKDGELNLQTFLKAREFEIKALEESMRHTKGAATKRAFQQVPRGMRRRTASHNVKRVPKRLRNRAMKEMRDDNTPTVTSRRRKPTTTRATIRSETARKLGILAEKRRKRKLKAAKEKASTDDGSMNDTPSIQTRITTRPARPKIRRNVLNDPPRPKSKFRKRQLQKTWLPTHLWHAKRARMTEPTKPLWRFAIPLTTNEKIYRATHRGQGERGAVAWDMSYMSTIGLYGNEIGVCQVLRKLGVVQESCWSERGQRWRAGTRHWNGMLSRDTRLGRRLICPATIQWNPQDAEQQRTPGNEDADPKKRQRQLFIRVHPSSFLELFNELLQLVKMQTPQLFIEDLRFEIGSIEITGPASTEVLLGVLQPYYTDLAKKEPHANIFSGLTSAATPSALPPNSCLAFSTLDPRLRYPPRKFAPPDLSDEGQSRLMNLLSSWPADKGLQPYSIFDRDQRFSASRLPRQKSVNKRKGARMPGTDLDPSPSDPPIPILLHASRSARGAEAQGTWTVLAPFKCIQPIWYSLVHFPLASGGNPRFAGLNEARQVPFERGLPYFPIDFLATDAGVEWEMEERARRKTAWERRPKSKRTAWETLDLGAGRKGELGAGWACDFEHLLRLDNAEAESPPHSVNGMDVDDAASDTKEAPEAEAEVKPAASSHPLKQLHHVSKSSLATILSSSAPAPPNAVMTVTLVLTGRGVADPCARIYRLPSRPAPLPPSSSAEVPASAPPLPQDAKSTAGLPADLRDQWLAQLAPSAAASRGPAADRPPPDADMATRKRFLARSLLAPAPLGYPPPKPNQTDMNGHPLVPGEEDLIGFVTTGAYCLSEGRARAIGSIVVDRVVEGLRDEARRKKAKGHVRETNLCIVRNAGEGVGWLARWEVA
ncbi:hypothetical protein VDGD_00312 [Verticillium dahliae]|nr:hypothetical protein VDGD_00312 [Verticillium dahliae]